jgi:hypothetical protein
VAASKALIAAVDAIADAIPPSPFLLDFTQNLLVAGGMLLLCERLAVITESEFGPQLQRHIEACLAGLRKVERVFPGAANYREILDNLVSRSTSARLRKARTAASALALPVPNGPSRPLPRTAAAAAAAAAIVSPPAAPHAPVSPTSTAMSDDPLAFFGDLANGDFTSAPDWFAGLDSLASFADPVAAPAEPNGVFEAWMAAAHTECVRENTVRRPAEAFALPGMVADAEALWWSSVASAGGGGGGGADGVEDEQDLRFRDA